MRQAVAHLVGKVRSFAWGEWLFGVNRHQGCVGNDDADLAWLASLIGVLLPLRVDQLSDASSSGCPCPWPKSGCPCACPKQNTDPASTP
jgi:hypothetical protein